MLELKNRVIDDYGTVVFGVKDLYPLILKGHNVVELTVKDSPEIQQLAKTCRELFQDDLMPTVYAAPETPVEARMDAYRNKWLIPEEYLGLNLREWLAERCKGETQCARVDYEMNVFEKYELENMLRSLIFLVDTFRKNEIVWGVGRGSSVASYVLFLIGIHRVDSLAYDLNFDEFLN